MIAHVADLSPVIISGSIAIDRIMAFTGNFSDHIRPANLGTLSVSIFLDSLHDSQGGVGANIAYSLALLGDSPVLLGSVGSDAKAYMKKLSELGVNTDYIHYSNLPTASFNVITDSMENQVGGFFPGAMFDSDPLTFERWRDQKPIVVVSPHDPKTMCRQVIESQRWGLRLCYDVGQQVTNLAASDLVAGVSAAEILILNDYELAALATKIQSSPEAIKASVPVVVTTLGKRGSVIEGASVPTKIKVGVVAPRVVEDPTGAGDAYRSGFFYGLARGWDLRLCAQLGATVAAYAVELRGTQSHSFGFDEVAARYRNAFADELPQKLTDQENISASINKA